MPDSRLTVTPKVVDEPSYSAASPFLRDHPVDQGASQATATPTAILSDNCSSRGSAASAPIIDIVAPRHDPAMVARLTSVARAHLTDTTALVATTRQAAMDALLAHQRFDTNVTVPADKFPALAKNGAGQSTESHKSPALLFLSEEAAIQAKLPGIEDFKSDAARAPSIMQTQELRDGASAISCLNEPAGADLAPQSPTDAQTAEHHLNDPDGTSSPGSATAPFVNLLGYDGSFDVYGGGGGGYSAGDGWSISVGPYYDPYGWNSFPPPPARPPAPSKQWTEAHSDKAMQVYADTYRAIYGRDAQEVDKQYAARQISDGTTLEKYRWNEAHTPAALQVYADVFRGIYGREAEDANKLYAASEVSRGLTVEEYRWNEAHSPAAMQVYAHTYRSIYGRDAQDVDKQYAAEQMNNGVTLEQYRWNEAHSAGAQNAIYSLFKSVFNSRPDQNLMAWYQDNLGKNTRLDDIRIDVAYSEGGRNLVLETYQNLVGIDASSSPAVRDLQRELADGRMNYAQLRTAIINVHGREAITQAYRDVANMDVTGQPIVESFERQLLDGETDYAKIRAAVANVHGREAITRAYRDVANMDVTGQPIVESFERQLLNGEMDYAKIRAAVANVHGRDAIVKTYGDVAGITPTDAQINAYKEALAKGTTSYQKMRSEVISSAEATQSLSANYKNVFGVAPSPEELQGLRDSLASGSDLQGLRHGWAYSARVTNTLNTIYDGYLKAKGIVQGEDAEFMRAAFTETQKFALAEGEAFLKSPEFYIAAGAFFVPGAGEAADPALFAEFETRRLIAKGVLTAVDFFRNNFYHNTSGLPKIQLTENATAPFPAPTRPVLDSYLSNFVSAGDFDLVGHVLDLPVNERLDFLKAITGQTADSIEQGLIYSNARDTEGASQAPDAEKVKQFLDNKPSGGGGGPGSWDEDPEYMKKSAADYQERVTGTPQGVVYKVVDRNGATVKFDAYDAETDTLLDAKLYKKWPVVEFSKSREEVVDQLKRQLEAAGTSKVEWIVPNEQAKSRILDSFREEKFLPDAKRFSIKVQP